MKPIPLFRTVISLLFTLCLTSAVLAQGTAFTYQGRLNLNGAPAQGNYDFQFTLFTTNQTGVAASPILVSTNIPVVNGLFTTALDFGSGIFNGTNLWLDIAVCTNGNGTFTELTPRQSITAAPYALTAGNLSSVIQNNIFSSGNFASVDGGSQNSALGTNATIAGGNSNSISDAGLNGTISGGQFNSVISPDSTVGGGVYNAEGTNTYLATISGGGYNSIGTNSSSTTISGGYDNVIGDNTLDAAIGGGSFNDIGTNSNYSVIAGGRENFIGANAFSAAIGGGWFNTIYGSNAVVAGGYGNFATGNGAAIPGGFENLANAQNSFAAGSSAWAVHADAFVWSDGNSGSSFSSAVSNEFAVHAQGGVRFVTGGAGISLDGQPVATTNGFSNLNAANITSGTLSDTRLSSDVAFLNSSLNAGNITSGTLADARLSGNVPLLNSALTTFAGDLSLNGGATYHHLEMSGGNSTGYLYASYPKYGDGIHLGYNYYADSTGLNHIINSGGGTSRITVSYNSIVLATGGVGVQPSFQNVAISGTTTTVSGTFNNSSDRNLKQDFKAITPSQILEKVAQLPVSEWSYKVDPTIRHVGPVAQDFYSTFNIGTDDKHIAPIDEGGVALAAIQGLNQKLDQTRAENAELKRENDTLAKQLANLATAVKSLQQKNLARSPKFQN